LPTYAKNGKTYVLADSDKAVLPVKIPAAYNDVKSDDWFASSVANATKLGIIVGDTSGNYRPRESVSAKDAIQMFMRVLGYAGTYDTIVVDGKAKGIGTVTFDATNPASRILAAQLIVDSLKSVGVDISAIDTTDVLKDYADIAGYAEKTAFAVCVKLGILKGFELPTADKIGKMSPTTALTRAQMATVATRLQQYITGQPITA
jgi:hypothetical protein